MPLLLVVLLVAAGCSPGVRHVTQDGSAASPGSGVSAPHWSRPGPQGNGQSSGPIVRVGAALSLTGQASVPGMAQRNGIKLAQDEINASHVLGATHLDVVVEDDASQREQAAAVFQRFIENSHVSAILGPTLSDVAFAVDPLAQQAGVPVLAVSNSAGGLTQIGNFIFRDCLSESQLTPEVVAHLRARLPLHSAALLYSDTDANRAGSHGYKKALQDAGVQITSEQVFAQDEVDVSQQLAEIAASQPDVLFISAPPHAAAPILIQARQHGLSGIPLIGSNGFNSLSVLKQAGDAAEGLIVGSAWSAANPNPENQQFIQNYRTRYGLEPDQFAAQAYTGVYIIAAAFEQAHPMTDPRAVRDALEQLVRTRLPTPLGAFTFSESRDAAYAPMVQIVKNGRFDLL